MSLPQPTADDPDAGNNSGLKGLILFTLIALTGVALGICTPLRQYLTIEAIRDLSQRLGAWGPVVLLAFGALGPLAFLPRWPVCFLGGVLYGVVWGSLLGIVASILGAWLHYATSKALVSTSTGQWLRRLHIDPQRLEKAKAFWLLFLLRAVPVSNSAATNVLAGALKISTGAYLAASFLGMIPSTIMYAAWGKLMKKPEPGLFVLALGILLAMMLGTVIIRRYVFRRR